MESTPPPSQLLTDEGKTNLLNATKWAGTLAWIILVILVLSLIIFGAMTLFISGALVGLVEGLVIAITFVVGAGIYGVVAYFLIKFSRMTTQGLLYGDSEMVTAGVKYLQYFFAYLTILAIVGIVLYGISFLGMGLFSTYL